MMDPSVLHATSGSQSTRPAPSQDDDTIVTPTRGERKKSNVRSSVEITLKFRFVPTNDNDNIHPAILHSHWIHEVLKAFGGDIIQFFDNRNRQVSKVDPFRINAEEHTQQFHLHFDRHTNRNKTSKPSDKLNFQSATSYIVHRIRSNVPLSEIKANAVVFKLMQDHNFYVNEHRWSETDWETTQLGFLYGLDPQFYDLDQVTTKFANTIRQALPRVKTPKFRLVYCSPKIKTEKGRIVRTKAYAVETMRADRDELNKQLKEVYKEDGTFIPFQMRACHPEAFESFIKAQTKMLASNYVIVLNNIGPDAMHYLSDRILAISGVISILPCPTVNEDGKYKVLVHQKNYHPVRNHLNETVPKWYEEFVEPDAKAPEGRYPGPPEVSPIDSDGNSQSDHLYMTISVNTAMSISSNLSNDSPPTVIYRREKQPPTDESTLGGSQATSSNIGKSASWADKVRGSRTYSSSEPTTTADSERHKALQQELAKGREEVAALKERLKKIEGAHAKEQATIEEKVQQQVLQVLQEQFRLFTQDMTTMFSQMMMSQQQSNATKRRAEHLDDRSEADKSSHTKGNSIDGVKRWDNRRTPQKIGRSQSEYDDQHSGMTPKQLADQMYNQSSSWNDDTPSTPTNGSRLVEGGARKDKGTLENSTSESVESDINEQGSGIKSTNKTSICEDMATEATEGNHE